MTRRKTADEKGLPFGGRNQMELFAFDLVPVKQAHPEQAAIFDKMSNGANPPLTWGFASTAELLKMHYVGKTLEYQKDHGVWAFVGETCRQRDLRMIEDMRRQMLEYADHLGGTDACLNVIRELKPAYFTATYPKDGSPATKVLKNKKHRRPRRRPDVRRQAA